MNAFIFEVINQLNALYPGQNICSLEKWQKRKINGENKCRTARLKVAFILK